MTMQSCWLSSSGQVTYCGFAEHNKTADILLQKLKPELFDAYNMPISLAYDPVAELEQLGYIRYCNWEALRVGLLTTLQNAQRHNVKQCLT